MRVWQKVRPLSMPKNYKLIVIGLLQFVMGLSPSSLSVVIPEIDQYCYSANLYIFDNITNRHSYNNKIVKTSQNYCHLLDNLYNKIPQHVNFKDGFSSDTPQPMLQCQMIY